MAAIFPGGGGGGGGVKRYNPSFNQIGSTWIGPYDKHG